MLGIIVVLPVDLVTRASGSMNPLGLRRFGDMEYCVEVLPTP
jgi:hypothetical protein